MTSGLGIEEVNRNGDENQTTNVDEVVLPLNAIKRNGIDEYVEEGCYSGSYVHAGHTTRSQLVLCDKLAMLAEPKQFTRIGSLPYRPDLAGVAEEEGSESNVVETVVDEEERYNGSSCCLCSRVGEGSR